MSDRLEQNSADPDHGGTDRLEQNSADPDHGGTDRLEQTVQIQIMVGQIGWNKPCRSRSWWDR